MSSPLEQWLEASSRDSEDPTLAVSDLRECNDPSEDTVTYLADQLLSSRVSPALLARVTERIGWRMARDAYLRLPRTILRHGAFGEVLASSCLVDLESYAIPYQKARVQIDSNQTLPGTDLVSVRISAGEITEAHFVECKLRTIKHSGAALSAYAQLATDQEAQFATIIMFTLARLDETNHPLFEPFLRYLERRANQELDTYGIFLAVENAICITDPAAEIAEIDRAIAPLHIRVVRISALANLITTVYERLGATPELEPDDVL